MPGGVRGLLHGDRAAERHQQQGEAARGVRHPGRGPARGSRRGRSRSRRSAAPPPAPRLWTTASRRRSSAGPGAPSRSEAVVVSSAAGANVPAGRPAARIAPGSQTIATTIAGRAPERAGRGQGRDARPPAPATAARCRGRPTTPPGLRRTAGSVRRRPPSGAHDRRSARAMAEGRFLERHHLGRQPPGLDRAEGRSAAPPLHGPRREGRSARAVSTAAQARQPAVHGAAIPRRRSRPRSAAARRAGGRGSRPRAPARGSGPPPRAASSRPPPRRRRRRGRRRRAAGRAGR